MLSGPAGFGKTTLLGEFIERYQQPVAWLSLDAADNDPTRFWIYFIEACQKIQPGFGNIVLALFQTPGPVPDDAIPTMLINEITSQGAKFALILDDYHVIQNPVIHKAMAFLLDHAPDHLHLIFSTRVDPPWPLSRFRSRKRLVEIRAADLRFTEAETADFMNHSMGLVISPQDIASLEARTEGWIAGLQLAALSMRGRDDIPEFIKAFTGSNTYIAEFLVEEVLQHLPEEIQLFLMQTSILERLNAALCDQVTGANNGQFNLLTLKRANLFVLPLDEEGVWFRYHHLFADLLQARLKQTVPSTGILKLHQCAAAWYSQNGFAVEAVEHAMAAKDFEMAAQLIEQNAYSLVTHGELATLARWIDVLPADMNHRPQFLLAKAWALLFTGDAIQIESLLSQIDAQISPDHAAPFDSELLGGAAAIRAFFALMAGDHTSALQLAEQAEKALLPTGVNPNTPNPFVFAARSILPYTIGMANRSQGKYDQAAQAFEQEIDMFAAPQDILGWTIATLEMAVIRRLQGRLSESEFIGYAALQRLADLGISPSGALSRVNLALGEVLRERNELEEASQRVNGTIDSMLSWNMPTDRLAAYLSLLRILISQNNIPAAKETIRVAKELRASAPVFLDLSRSLDILEIRLALLEHEFAKAETLMDTLQPGTCNIVFLQEQEMVLLARLRLAQHRPDEVLAVLEPLVKLAEKGGHLYAWLEMQVQRSLSLEARGDRQAALGVLQQILGFAEKENFVRVFVDEGAAMHELLAIAAHQAWAGAYTGYFTKLLRAFPTTEKPGMPAPAATNSDGLIEPLTAREHEVLKLIAEGNSNQAIAEKLVITVSAVKKHTGNIFGKLNVNSRTQAVARARQLGLLSS